MKQIILSEFPAFFQQLFNQVQETGNPLTVVQDGKPIVTIYPAKSSKRGKFGVVRGTGEILGDLVKPSLSSDTWEVLQ